MGTALAVGIVLGLLIGFLLGDMWGAQQERTRRDREDNERRLKGP
jgi:hypothetical protein